MHKLCLFTSDYSNHQINLNKEKSAVLDKKKQESEDMKSRAMRLSLMALMAELNISITSRGLKQHCGKGLWQTQYLN